MTKRETLKVKLVLVYACFLDLENKEVLNTYRNPLTKKHCNRWEELSPTYCKIMANKVETLRE